MKLLVALLAAMPIFGQCTFSLNPTSITLDPGVSPNTGLGGPAIAIDTQPGCSWFAGTTTPWLHVMPGSTTGTGPGTVRWNADRNTVPFARIGSITINTQPVTIMQTAPVCTYSVIPAADSISAAGGGKTVQVVTGCSWVATASQTWITLPKNVGGTSNAGIDYTVAPNACATPRTATVLAGLPGTNSSQYQATFTLTQDGSPDNLTVSPAALTLGPDAVDGKITVTTGTGCPWTASADVSWFQLVQPVSGSGSGSVSYHVIANTSAARTGNIRIGGRTIPLTQQGVATPVPALTSVTNAASGATGPVSPGEIVSIYGDKLGPTPGLPLQLSADGQSVSKSLGGVQVLFDGVAAALTYAGTRQINAVVPYSVAGKTTTNLQVQYQANSALLPLDVQAATPGIFTQDNSGIGLGAILNQDYSLNAPANRAAIGDIVQIYCTGGGVTDPPGTDGALAQSPYPALIQPVSVTIGGIDAPVIYKGAAPSLISGLTQINAKVPVGVTAGIGVPVIVQVGSWKSQSGVTIAIR